MFDFIDLEFGGVTVQSLFIAFLPPKNTQWKTRESQIRQCFDARLDFLILN